MDFGLRNRYIGRINVNSPAKMSNVNSPLMGPIVEQDFIRYG
jgi:hypothetical protein